MEDDFDPPFACAAKVECCCAKWFSPQDGHASSGAPLRTSFSNLVPQSSHRYSKIGIWLILFYSTSVKAIFSIHARTLLAGAAKLFTRMENASFPLVFESA